MNTTDHYPSNTSHRELAAGILKQVKNDLHRFHRGTSKVERELYLDAYRWVMSDDCSWPFSFLNVCQLMGLTPEQLRQELIDDQSLGIFRNGLRRIGRMVSGLRSSFTQLFANEGNTGAKKSTSSRTKIDAHSVIVTVG
jgi:hypothetical protein